jgi:hypothetical protein
LREAKKGEKNHMTERETEQLIHLREKMAQIKAQEQSIITKDKKRQRKERTHRLIQNGALAEKYLNCDGMISFEFEKVLKKIVAVEEVKVLIKK